MQMTAMEQEMAKRDMTPERHKQMTAQLQEMSKMMRRMAGLADRPSMTDAEIGKEIEDMRRQMARLRQQRR